MAATNDDLRGKMTVLADKLGTLKSTADTLENIIEREKKSSKTKLEKLKAKLAAARKTLAEVTAKEEECRKNIKVISDL